MARASSAALREVAARLEKAAPAATDAQEKRALVATDLTQGQAKRVAELMAELMRSANEAKLLNDSAAAYLSRGAEGDAKVALDMLERAVKIEPKRAEVWFNLGLAAEKAEQLSRAAEAWKTYLVLDPSSDWAAEARRHLEKMKR